ncbi:TlpA disulfide reductase family protein [Thiomonas sp. SCN 64-16]|uniref:TlpA family protein disulfide reductase n=1 Tax=Thiomonas sp. SCN 64-16 TaxID=1660151 RepID=UPI000A740EB8|nr:TlpA disulfide reductase family protein [Thiomonas sp. SCN 64-16]
MQSLTVFLRRVGAAIVFCAACAPASWAAGFTFTPYPTAHKLPLSQVTFENAQGKHMTLADFKGKVVLLNIWATWCPPCVHEMPTLDKLQKLLGGKNFAVVPLSVDKGGIYTVKSFYDDNFISHLPIYVDPTTQVLDTLSILGTPTTILINKQGEEIACGRFRHAEARFVNTGFVDKGHAYFGPSFRLAKTAGSPGGSE